MNLKNRAICTKCTKEMISTKGGEMVECPCGESYIDTDRWDASSIRFGGSAMYAPDTDTIIAQIIIKMCEVVGASFYQLDTKKQDWFHDYEWTQKQQDEFVEYLVGYFTENKKYLKLISSHINTSKKDIRKLAEEFVFNYGWKVKQ